MFADVKADNYDESKNSIIACINDAYQSHRYLLKSNLLTDGEKEIFRTISGNPRQFNYRDESARLCMSAP